MRFLNDYYGFYYGKVQIVPIPPLWILCLFYRANLKQFSCILLIEFLEKKFDFYIEVLYD